MRIGATAFGALVAACTSGSSQSPGPPVERPSGTPTFANIADDVGLRFRHGAFRWGVSPDVAAMMGGGVCWLDYDDDGWLDLFVVNSYARSETPRWEAAGGLPRSALFHNEGGTFTDVSAGSGADLAAQGQGCVAADLDLDGRTDLYVTTAQDGALLWNEGDGTFTEGAAEAGVEAFGWHAGAAVGDIDADGLPDLFLSGYADLSSPNPAATQGFPSTYFGVRDLLYLNRGSGEDGRPTFEEVGVGAGLEVVNAEYGLGATLSDLDRDGDLDLYVANDTNPNRLFDNVPWPGGAQADPDGLGFRFEELAGRAGVADPGAGMGIAEGDYDGNGRTDLFVTNARGQLHAVYRGTPSDAVDPAFVDGRLDFGVELEAATGWGVSWGDLDLDTDLDLMLVNGEVPVTDLAQDSRPVQVFGNLTAQGSPGLFEDQSASLGLPQIGPLLARGSAAADFDNDGDLDVAVNVIGGDLVLLENTGVSSNWLEVRLGAFAPGAVITAVLPDGTELVRHAIAGSSYLSSEDPRCHFGLGDAVRISELRVHWPGGQESVLSDLEANQVIKVEAPG